MIATPRAYLDGNWAPVQDELTEGALPILGQLPAELSGMFVRNGPNPRFPPLGRHHWFDGDGMLHGVRLHEGTAAYLNRYVRTRGLELEEGAGHALWTGLVEPPQPDVPVQSAFIRWKKNVANTALIQHGGRLLALWDTGEPYEIRAPDLTTVGPFAFGGELTFPILSHPKLDPSTGELMIMGNVMKRTARLHLGVVSPDGDLGHTAEVALPRAVYMHDFAITERYTVVMDLPLTFSAERAQRGESPYRFERELPGRIGVVPRRGDGGSARWFEIPACFVAHTLNAYEEGGAVVLLGCRMDSIALGSPQVEGGPLYQDPPRLHQWRLDLETGGVSERALDDLPIEFPIINARCQGRKARYGYAGRMAPNQLYLMDAFVKYDLRDGASRAHELGAGRYGGDAELVPRPGATDEDDGWLLAFVHDEREGRSELLVLDARDLAAPPVARVIMPRRVPYGVHSTWLPSGAR